MFTGDPAGVDLKSMTDGTSNTLRSSRRPAPFRGPSPTTFRSHQEPPCSGWEANIPGGSTRRWGTGSVRFMKGTANNPTSPTLIKALVTRDGGEVVSPAVTAVAPSLADMRPRSSKSLLTFRFVLQSYIALRCKVGGVSFLAGSARKTVILWTQDSIMSTQWIPRADDGPSSRPGNRAGAKSCEVCLVDQPVLSQGPACEFWQARADTVAGIDEHRGCDSAGLGGRLLGRELAARPAAVGSVSGSRRDHGSFDVRRAGI